MMKINFEHPIAVRLRVSRSKNALDRLERTGSVPKAHLDEALEMAMKTDDHLLIAKAIKVASADDAAMLTAKLGGMKETASDKIKAEIEQSLDQLTLKEKK
jgi:hypothetical protein